jgi:hypothetical protein
VESCVLCPQDLLRDVQLGFALSIHVAVKGQMGCRYRTCDAAKEKRAFHIQRGKK